MTDDQEPKMPGDSADREQKVRAGEVLQQLVSRDPELWSNAFVHHNNYEKGGLRNSGYTKRILGATEGGAKIQASDIQFKAEQARAVPYYIGSDLVGSKQVWEITDDTHGLNIVVLTGSDDKKRRLEMFIPDDPGVEELYRAHKIEIQTAAGDQILMPKDGEAFDKALAEVEYYLGEPIEWDEKTPSFDEVPHL